MTADRATAIIGAMTRFLIVDDHPLFREALLSAIRLAYPDADAQEARTVSEALALVAASPAFDLVLLDLNMPGVHGFEGLRELRTLHPRLPVAIVSGHEEPRIISEALSYGVAGFIPKSVRKADLAAAIGAILNGAVHVPEGYQPPAGDDEDDRGAILARLATLTPQQARVLQMLKQGLLNKQIAYELKVGETTIKAHVSEILRKLNVYSRTQAVIEVSKLDVQDFFRDDGSYSADRPATVSGEQVGHQRA